MKQYINELEQKILKEYKNLYERSQPEGVFPVAPAIPFIGNKIKNPRVLVYASAENLTYAYDKELIKNKEKVIHQLGLDQYTRSRYFSIHKERGTSPFLDLHIQPINDGSLLAATRYILKMLGVDQSFSFNPLEFIENISVANFGKFSIANRNNKDYAKNFSMLRESLEYVKQDLTVIRPEILVMPKTIYNTVKNKDEWKAIITDSGKSIKTIFLIYQTNRRVINTHISRQIKGQDYNKYKSPFQKDWPDNISEVKGMAKYFCWLELMKEKLLIKL